MFNIIAYEINFLLHFIKIRILLCTIDIKLWLDDKIALVNSKKTALDVPPQISNGRTMVPVRFVAENLGADVEWVQTTKEAKISFNKLEPAKGAPEEDAKGGAENPGNAYAIPKQPLFNIDNSLEVLNGNMGRVTFRLNYLRILGEHTGFKLYYTNDDGNPDVFEFGDEGFYYEEILGKTVDISVTCVNNTAESTPLRLTFAMLDRVNGKEIWSERQKDDLLGSPCWYGMSWDAVTGAANYKVYVSKDISSWMNFINKRELSGFTSIITSDTYFSTKTTAGLPNELVNATWGEERYVVVFPLNADGEMGPFPRYYKIPMTGVSTKATN